MSESLLKEIHKQQMEVIAKAEEATVETAAINEIASDTSCPKCNEEMQLKKGKGLPMNVCFTCRIALPSNK